ncbi:hypothetical protein R3P38DRAFT_3278265 [Favolaschia claudopus]|uniref:Uncharacterized protein n=1 Tax=Favolaschia claudopus TaxID=2862362 RepID=A0AAW0AJH4_9AGAR
MRAVYVTFESMGVGREIQAQEAAPDVLDVRPFPAKITGRAAAVVVNWSEKGEPLSGAPQPPEYRGHAALWPPSTLWIAASTGAAALILLNYIGIYQSTSQSSGIGVSLRIAIVLWVPLDTAAPPFLLLLPASIWRFSLLGGSAATTGAFLPGFLYRPLPPTLDRSFADIRDLFCLSTSLHGTDPPPSPPPRLLAPSTPSIASFSPPHDLFISLSILEAHPRAYCAHTLARRRLQNRRSPVS